MVFPTSNENAVIAGRGYTGSQPMKGKALFASQLPEEITF